AAAQAVVAPAWPGPRRDDHASWSRRVGASLLDSVPGLVAAVLLVTGYLPTYLGFFRGDLTVAPRYPLVVVGSLLYLVALGLAVCNRYVLAGRTGQSVGKRLTRIYLVRQTTGRPIGTLDAFVRDLLHVLDGFGYVGYLWPLWDEE
ncbi:RDD family protein, partial [Ralstonia sp. VS2407]